GEVEMRYAGRRGLEPGRRLSCQAGLLADVLVDVPETSQVHRQVVRKRPDVCPVRVDPVLTLHYVEVAPADLNLPGSDLRRLRQALAAQWGLRELRCDLHVLGGLQAVLREGRWRVTAAVHERRE